MHPSATCIKTAICFNTISKDMAAVIATESATHECLGQRAVWTWVCFATGNGICVCHNPHHDHENAFVFTVSHHHVGRGVNHHSTAHERLFSVEETSSPERHQHADSQTQAKSAQSAAKSANPNSSNESLHETPRCIAAPSQCPPKLSEKRMWKRSAL